MWISCLLRIMKYLCGGLLLVVSWIAWQVNNWFSIWMLIETAMVFLLGFISMRDKYQSSESLTKYFVIQVIVSLVLLVCVIISIFLKRMVINIWLIIMLCMKIGMFPFQFWLVSLVGKISWFSYLALGSFSKIIPILMSYYGLRVIFLIIIVRTSSLMGRIIGINNTRLQKILSYSSIIHVSWRLCGLTISTQVFYVYFSGYLIMMCWMGVFCHEIGAFIVNQLTLLGNKIHKIVILMHGLRLAGFPPFIGFMIKWMVISLVLKTSYAIVLVALLFRSLLATVFYLQIWFLILIVQRSNCKWCSIFTTEFVAGLWVIGRWFLIFGFM